MNEYFKMLLIICPLVFTAGFVDAIAGGGGIISIPAYLFAGLPAHMAVGTNKFAMSIGTAVSSRNYIAAGKINFSAAFYSILGALAGSALGSKFSLFISEETLKLILMIILPVVAVFLAIPKKTKEVSEEKKEIGNIKFRGISLAIGFFIGMYDGLAGPGTGTFMILAFTGLLGMDLITASGCSKVSNLASNISSLIVFALNQKVMYQVAVPAALCAVTGNYIGSKLAIKGGAKYIRIVIFGVLILLFIKTGYDLLQI